MIAQIAARLSTLVHFILLLNLFNITILGNLIRLSRVTCLTLYFNSVYTRSSFSFSTALQGNFPHSPKLRYTMFYHPWMLQKLMVLMELAQLYSRQVLYPSLSAPLAYLHVCKFIFLFQLHQHV